MTSLFAIIPGFGEPHWDLKTSILRNNINVLSYFPGLWQLVICQYTLDRELPSDISEHPNIHVIKEKGIVGEFLITHSPPHKISEFTHVFAFLDDVELVGHTFNWNVALKYLTDFRVDIVSPTLTEDSAVQFPYMVTKPTALFAAKMTPCCEFFCYLMTSESYKKYYTHALDIENPWMWGIDLVLKLKHGLQPLLVNHINMRHYIKNASYNDHPDKDPIVCRDRYLTKLGADILEVAKQPTEMYFIVQA